MDTGSLCGSLLRATWKIGIERERGGGVEDGNIIIGLITRNRIQG
jgi:hypothetical protein